MKRFDEAQTHFERALKFNQQMGALPPEAKTQYEYGSMLLLRELGGDRERAQAFLHHALNTAAALNMKELERRVQKVLAPIVTM